MLQLSSSQVLQYCLIESTSASFVSSGVVACSAKSELISDYRMLVIATYE